MILNLQKTVNTLQKKNSHGSLTLMPEMATFYHITTFVLFCFIFTYFLLEREKDRDHNGERQRGRERGKQTPCLVWSSRRGWGIPWLLDHDLSQTNKSQTLELCYPWGHPHLLSHFLSHLFPSFPFSFLLLSFPPSFLPLSVAHNHSWN